MCDRSFAVGACHMHRFEVMMGVVEEFEELNGVVKVGFVCGGSDALIHRQFVEHPFEGFLVGHGDYLVTKV